MLKCLLLIFPLLMAESDDGILNNPPAKPMKEFLDEYTPPSPSNKSITVISVNVIQKAGRTIHIIKLSNEETYLIRPTDADIVEGWVLGPEVEVVSSKKFEGYPYKILKKGTSSYVYARKYTEETPPSQ